MGLKSFILKNIPLNKKMIVFESLNDFDCNSGALYNYIIENELNKKFKIIWLVKNKNNKIRKKVKNVKIMDYYHRPLLDRLYFRRAKYLIWDNEPIEKLNQRQVSIYLTHGFPAIKNVKGLINIPESCDYFIMTSKNLENYAKEQFSIKNNTKFIYAGLPRNDLLFQQNNEITKVTSQKYNKVIIWMPTFRKSKFEDRNDTNKKLNLGIPLINSINEFKKLNSVLEENNDLLILKIHGGQDQSILKVKNLSNIKIITIEDEKNLNINLYKLISNTDALLTDYSSIAFDYLLLDKPIGYIIDDINEYKLGFGFDNIFEMMPGNKIKTLDELLNFINDLNKGKDDYKKDRKKVLNYINEYQDDKNCERIIEYIEGGLR